MRNPVIPFIRVCFSLALTLTGVASWSQAAIGTNTPHPSAMLDVSSPDRGVLFPTAYLFNIDSSAPIMAYRDFQTDYTPYSLLVYNTNPNPENRLSGPGFYWWNGTRWFSIADAGKSWKINGNAGVPGLQLGALDIYGMGFTRNGITAGRMGDYHTIFGVGNRNYSQSGVTAFGAESLLAPKNQSAFNVAIGYASLQIDSAGGSNVGIGSYAMSKKKQGVNNTAIGYDALLSNQSSYNTAVGVEALAANTTGNYNTGIGYGTSTGTNKIFSAAFGADALANCSKCLVFGGTGAAAVKVGIGTTAPTADLDIIQQSDSMGITLKSAGTSASWTTYVDNSGNYVFKRFGATVTYIEGSTGKLIVVSDARRKKNISTMPAVLPSVMQLQPRTYRYLTSPDQKPSIGFIAQEVENIFPGMVATTADGYKGISYASFGVIAIKTIQEQQAIMAKQDLLIESLQKRLDALEQHR